MFVQAIVTKYVGPTNTRPARIKATAGAGSVTVPYDHSLGMNGNHTVAAAALAAKFGWAGFYVGGGMPDGNGNVYVLSEAVPEAYRADECFRAFAAS